MIFEILRAMAMAEQSYRHIIDYFMLAQKRHPRY
jgi:hypothetical protein